jgi:hypothetical protein
MSATWPGCQQPSACHHLHIAQLLQATSIHTRACQLVGCCKHVGRTALAELPKRTLNLSCTYAQSTSANSRHGVQPLAMM